jgi:small-conductance mechanosensitive channel
VNEFMLEVWIDDIWEFDEISSELRFHIWDELEARGLNFPVYQQEVMLREIGRADSSG